MDHVAAFLQRLVSIVEPIAERLGGPGLTLVAFFDSSFISLPEASDALVVILTVKHPSEWLYFAAMTTLGSVMGCYALYSLGRRGGEGGGDSAGQEGGDGAGEVVRRIGSVHSATPGDVVVRAYQDRAVLTDLA